MSLDVERLAQALPEVPRSELERLARAWSRRGPDEPNDFVSWLHANGEIGDETVRRVARSTRAPVQVMPPESLANDDGLRVLGAVGKGGMGEVLMARDERLHRTVALKRLDGRHLVDAGMIRRFVAEAQLTAQLDHPGIVPVHRVDAPPGEGPSYAMKLVRGQTLKEWMTTAAEKAERKEPLGRYALPIRLELFCQVCEPVAYAHARGVLHRDLKPDNVMVGPFGEVFVMDWGMAKVVGQGEGDWTVTGPAMEDTTQAGAVVGTPSYMSPEQARGENTTIDARSDQYALGLILFELATLRRARGSLKGARAVLQAAAGGHVDPIVPRGEPLPRELVAVIRKATANRREDRYSDVTALLEDVHRVIRGEAVSAAPDTALQRAGRWVARHKERVAVGAGIAALFAVIGVLSVVVGGFALREWDRVEADRRAAQLVDISAAAAGRAAGLDRTFFRAEGLLRGLAGAAERALRAEDAPGTVVYTVAAYKDPATAPPDMTASTLYGAPTSLGWPDLAIAPSASPTPARLRLLASLGPDLARALSHSADSPLSNELLLKDGAPVVWSYVATSDGLLVGYPGVGAYPPDYDPRGRQWYQEGLGHDGPGWGRPYVDESGLGLLMSCTMPLRREDTIVGVAGVDLTVRNLVAKWLSPGEGAEGFLVDADGNVVVRSQGGKGLGAALSTTPFPVVGAEIVWGTPAGQATFGDQLVTWTRLASVPWTYVVVGATPSGP